MLGHCNVLYDNRNYSLVRMAADPLLMRSIAISKSAVHHSFLVR